MVHRRLPHTKTPRMGIELQSEEGQGLDRSDDGTEELIRNSFLLDSSYMMDREGGTADFWPRFPFLFLSRPPTAKTENLKESPRKPLRTASLLSSLFRSLLSPIFSKIRLLQIERTKMTLLAFISKLHSRNPRNSKDQNDPLFTFFTKIALFLFAI